MGLGTRRQRTPPSARRCRAGHPPPHCVRRRRSLSLASRGSTFAAPSGAAKGRELGWAGYPSATHSSVCPPLTRRPSTSSLREEEKPSLSLASRGSTFAAPSGAAKGREFGWAGYPSATNSSVCPPLTRRSSTSSLREEEKPSLSLASRGSTFAAPSGAAKGRELGGAGCPSARNSSVCPALTRRPSTSSLREEETLSLPRFAREYVCSAVRRCKGEGVGLGWVPVGNELLRLPGADAPVIHLLASEEETNEAHATPSLRQPTAATPPPAARAHRRRARRGP